MVREREKKSHRWSGTWRYLEAGLSECPGWLRWAAAREESIVDPPLERLMFPPGEFRFVIRGRVCYYLKSTIPWAVPTTSPRARARDSCLPPMHVLRRRASPLSTPRQTCWPRCRGDVTPTTATAAESNANGRRVPLLLALAPHAGAPAASRRARLWRQQQPELDPPPFLFM